MTLLASSFSTHLSVRLKNLFLTFRSHTLAFTGTFFRQRLSSQHKSPLEYIRQIGGKTQFWIMAFKKISSYLVEKRKNLQFFPAFFSRCLLMRVQYVLYSNWYSYLITNFRRKKHWWDNCSPPLLPPPFLPCCLDATTTKKLQWGPKVLLKTLFNKLKVTTTNHCDFWNIP